MAHHEIHSLADLTTSTVTLQYKLCTLEQQRRFQGVFPGRELLQTTIQNLRDTQIHSHDCMVPKQYQTSMRPGGEAQWLAMVGGDDETLSTPSFAPEMGPTRRAGVAGPGMPSGLTGWCHNVLQH
jgi:hypothetical protein